MTTVTFHSEGSRLESFEVKGHSGYAQEELVMLDADRFVKMVRSFGAHRILFGTDSPWSDQHESIAWITETGLTAEEKTAILGENAKKLLNL